MSEGLPHGKNYPLEKCPLQLVIYLVVQCQLVFLELELKGSLLSLIVFFCGFLLHPSFPFFTCTLMIDDTLLVFVIFAASIAVMRRGVTDTQPHKSPS